MLNEIPDYGEQLLRCQRYQVKFGSNYGGLNNTWLGVGFAVSADAARILIELPEELRAAPTATFENLYAVAPTAGFTQRKVTAVRNLWPPTGNKTTIQVTLSESVLTVGEPVLLNAYATSYLLLDANL